MPTINVNTTAIAVGAFTTGDTVNLTLYDLDQTVSPFEVPLTSTICSELFNDSGVSTEVFHWSFDNIQGGQRTGNFLYQMKNQLGQYQSDIYQIIPDGGISPGPIHPVTIQLYEYDAVNNIQTTTPIIDAPTYIYNSSESVVITIKNSNSEGQSLIPLNDGTYVVAPQKAGTSFSKETFTITDGVINQSGGGVVSAVNVYGSVYTVPSPENVVNACRVYAHCFDINSITPLTTLNAFAQIRTEYYNLDQKLHSVETRQGVYNPATGLVYWDIVWGSDVVFNIEETGVKKNAVIPSQLVTRLMDL